MFKINAKLLPIKAHYFFFMAAMGPILPQLSVLGRQLGISADIMGYITSILPIFYVLAKPVVGYLADYFSNFRKCIFMSIIITMTLCYSGFYFVSHPQTHLIDMQTKVNFTISNEGLNHCDMKRVNHQSLCNTMRKMICIQTDGNFIHIYLTSITNSSLNITEIDLSFNNQYFEICSTEEYLPKLTERSYLKISCQPDPYDVPDCLYNTLTFWLFVILMCLGTIGFNVTNCISDAICFDMLGESQEMQYGAQRVWGTIGFGFTALLAGIVVNLWTIDAVKSFTPALIVMLVFSGFDLVSVTKLKLPKLSSAESILNEVLILFRQQQIAIFLVFATLAGIFDSFIIYYMFWHLEEVAERTGYMESIKLIEGCVIAAECLGGEILFFLVSGKILKRLGYVHCLSLCFFTYSLRLGMISLIPNPWWLVIIELFMQGCTYALCYTCIVAYASAIAPPGTSATIQGLVAGMDDGLGFAIGSLIGGQFYKYLGGSRSFQIFSLAAIIACISHIILRPATQYETHTSKIGYVIPSEQIKMNIQN